MIKLYPWDPAEDLETEEDMNEYLEAALEQDDDSWGVAYVLSDISRSKGMEWAVETPINPIAITAAADSSRNHHKSQPPLTAARAKRTIKAGRVSSEKGDSPRRFFGGLSESGFTGL